MVVALAVLSGGGCGRVGFSPASSMDGGTTRDGGDGGGGDGGAAPDAISTFCDVQVDVNANGTSDCAENAIGYGQFASDVMPWITNTTANLVWSSNDARGSSSSGAATITNVVPMTTVNGAWVSSPCIPVTLNVNYGAYTNYWMAGGQPGGDASNSVWITVDLYGDNACTSPFGGISGGVLGATKNAWDTYYRSFSTGSARSIVLDLGVLKGATTSAVSAQFDNVMLVRE